MLCNRIVRGAALTAALFLVVVASASAQAPGGQPGEAPAMLKVLLPADAKLVIEGDKTRQTGPERRFLSPPLAAGVNYRYTLEVTFMKDGKEVTRTEVARVQAGRETVVDLRGEAKKTDVARKPDETIRPADFKKTEETIKQPADTKKPEETTKKTDEAKKPEDKKPAATDDKPDRKPDVIFVPTPQEVVDKMLELAEVKKDDVVYDLGCGDGRIPVTAAKKFGCKAMGFDIDPERVKDSKENVEKNKVGELVTIEKKDIFTLDLSKANVVTLYLLPTLNVKLIPQLEKLKPGSRIVSHDFDMKGVKPKKVVTVKTKDQGEHTVYLWVTPLEKEKE